MKKSFLKLLLLSTSYFLLFIVVSAVTPAELKDALDKKNSELQKVNSQIQEIQGNLEEVKKEEKTLKKEVSKIDSQINQLKLNIRLSEITIEKLGLEIEDLQYKIIDSEGKINKKKKSIVEIFRAIQSKDWENALTTFLKNKTLADGVLESQSLNDLSARLNSEIYELQILKDELGGKLNESSDKKKSKENENSNLKNRRGIIEDVKKNKKVLLEQTKNQEKNYQQKLSELEKLQDEISDEIDILEEELRLKIDPTLLPIPRPGVLGLPILIPPAKDTFTSQQKHGFTRNRGKRYHNGLDFGAPIGTPLLAAESGVVIAVGDQDNYKTNGKKLCYRAAYGKFAMIKHENNLTTMYAHLSRWVVKVGDKVERGQTIGYSGNTGRSTGPHLHFVVYATQTIPPAAPGFYEGTRSSRICGPLPIGGDINPLKYLDL